jgi:hypothetical protein
MIISVIKKLLQQEDCIWLSALYRDRSICGYRLVLRVDIIRTMLLYFLALGLILQTTAGKVGTSSPSFVCHVQM